MFRVSPNSYGLGAAIVSMPVALSRVSCRPEAALAERAQQIAQRAVTEEIEALIGHLEACWRRVRTEAAARAARLALGAIGLQIGRRRDEPFLHHAIDDVLDEFFQLRSRIGLVGIGRVAQQSLERFLRQHAAVEERVHDGVVQGLHRAVVFGLAVHAAVRRLEPARKEQIRQLLDQVVEIEIVQRIAGVFGVFVSHVMLRN